MTFFLTRVIYDDDFLLDEEVVVGYYGGYVGEKLYLLEDMQYPKLNTTYHFYNSTMIELYGYQVFIVEAPHQMSIDEIIDSTNQVLLVPPTDDGTGGSGTPYFNTTFASATTINSSVVISNLWITRDFPRFYKFSFSGFNRLLVASTLGDTDVTLTLYNSNHQVIAFNDDVYDISIDINSHIVKEQLSSGTYYVKIERKSYGLMESIQFLLDSSPFQVEPNDETIPSVNTNSQVVVKDSTNGILSVEIGYTMSIWNSLDSNKMILESPSNAATVDVKVVSTLPINTIGLYTHYSLLNGEISQIELNQYKLEEYNGTDNILYRIYIIAHELGHALGIRHVVNNRNIMAADNLQKRLGLVLHDINVFRQYWG